MPNIIRDRRDDLIRAFTYALEQCEKSLDERIEHESKYAESIPIFKAEIMFRFKGMRIMCAPEFDLVKPIPDPIPTTMAYPVGGYPQHVSEGGC